MLEEAVSLIRELWTGEVVTREGKHYQVDTARIYTLPDEPPPIYMSAFGPKALEVAGRIADGFICTQDDADMVVVVQGEVRRQARQGGYKVAWADTADEGVDHAHRLWANAGLPGELAQVLPSPQHFEQASAARDPLLDRGQRRGRPQDRGARGADAAPSWTPVTTRCTSRTWAPLRADDRGLRHARSCPPFGEPSRAA